MGDASGRLLMVVASHRRLRLFTSRGWSPCRHMAENSNPFSRAWRSATFLLWRGASDQVVVGIDRPAYRRGWTAWRTSPLKAAAIARVRASWLGTHIIWRDNCSRAEFWFDGKVVAELELDDAGCRYRLKDRPK